MHNRDWLARTPVGTALEEDVELETVLSTLIGRQAAKRLAGALGRRGIESLDERAVESLAGVPARVARRLVAARDLGELLRGDDGPPLTGVHDVLRHLPRGLRTLETEVLLALALDARLQVKTVFVLARGGANSASVSLKEVFVPLLRVAATGVILVHTHPSGDPTPSNADVVLTYRVAQVGQLLGIEVVDHVVIARQGNASLAELELLPTDAELCAFRDQFSMTEQ